jgi:D-alanine-D-alanine ligase
MNILIIYGGKSCEHDISIITACLAKGYFDGKIVSAYFDKQNRCFCVANDFTPSKHASAQFKEQIVFCFGEKRIAICKGKRIKRYVDIDVAVNCCHGICGEDGTVAGICQMLGVPLVGSNILSSAIAMDKFATKQALRSIGMPTVMGKRITHEQYKSGTFSTGNLGYPIIVKPNKLGSSIGITVCHNKSELQKALDLAFCYDSDVLCERALTNFYEVNCSAMRIDDIVQCSDVDTPVTTHDLLTFDDKYISGSKWCKPTVNVDENVQLQVKDMTKQIAGCFLVLDTIFFDFLRGCFCDEKFLGFGQIGGICSNIIAVGTVTNFVAVRVFTAGFL